MNTKAKGRCMGVCTTVANKTGIDVFYIRLITILLALFTGGTIMIIYILLGLFASEA